MSRRIFRDVEESIFREVRRITFDSKRTTSLTVLQDVYDVFTGEVLQTPIEPSLYDSSADTNNIQYPHFFVKLLYSREDRFTGRVIPQYNKELINPINTAPQAFSIVLNLQDITINSPGNTFTTTNFQIGKIQVGYLLRILTGNNIGTYIVSSVDISTHTITVNNILVNNLPTLLFDANTNTVFTSSPVDLSTIQEGDILVDSTSAQFPILTVNTNNSSFTILGSNGPNLGINAHILRTPNAFKNIDASLDFGIIMDPSQPVIKTFYSADFEIADQQTLQAAAKYQAVSPAIPIDAYYLVRIDSKERDSHIDVINRVWEEFNPPRTGLPTIIRTENSADELLTANVLSGGSQTITVSDNSLFSINDSVFVIDKFHPTKSSNGSFETPFSSKIIGKIGLDRLILRDIVPDTFTTATETRVISNADYYLLMFHFVDHKTKDVEGAQYWSHEFTFWVQFWIDRQGAITNYDNVVQRIDTSLEDLITGKIEST